MMLVLGISCLSSMALIQAAGPFLSSESNDRTTAGSTYEYMSFVGLALEATNPSAFTAFLVASTVIFGATGIRIFQELRKRLHSTNKNNHHRKDDVESGKLAARQDFGSRLVYTHRYHCHPINFAIHFLTLPIQLLVFWVLPALWLLPFSSAMSTNVIATTCALYYSSIEIFVAILLSMQTYLVCRVATALDFDSDGTLALYATGFCLLSMLILQLVVGHHGLQGGNPAFEAYDAFCVLPFYLWAQVLNWCGHVSFTQELGIPSAPINAEIAPYEEPAFLTVDGCRNYCGNGQIAGSLRIYFPARLQHLVAIVKRAQQLTKKIRVVGASHSYNAAMTCSDSGQIIVRTQLLRDIKVDVASGTARVQAGVTVGELDIVLAKHGLCVPTNVILTSVTWGGIVSTGSHGSGYAPMCDSVKSLTLVDGRGRIRVLERKLHGDTFAAAVLSLGTCGLIYDMVIQARPMAILSMRDVHLPSFPTTTELIENTRSLDQFEVFTFGSHCFRREFEQVQMKTVSLSQILSNELKKYIMKATGTFSWQVASWIMGCNFRAGYQLLSAASQGQSTILMQRLGSAPDMIHFCRRIEDHPSYSTEFALRVSDVPRAIAIAHEVRRDFEERGENPMFVIGECRLTPPGKSLLQPGPRRVGGNGSDNHVNEEDWVAWVEILGTKAYDSDQRFWSFAAEWSKRIIVEFPHALPHWGKGFEGLPSHVLKKLLHRNYGSRLETFVKEQRKLDPNGIFLNEKLEALFDLSISQS